MTHIVWDWNGTLFDDAGAMVEATNEVFRPYGLPLLDLPAFRAGFTRPVWDYYSGLLGRPLEPGEWERLDAAFHVSYHRLMTGCGLAGDAVTSLSAFDAAGHSQSLLSMWLHERLVPTVTGLGIAPHFRRIDGLVSGEEGGSKARFLVRHLEALAVDPADVVLIGDSADDVSSALALGARGVGYTGGLQHRGAFEALGVPVVDRLADLADHL